MDSAIVTAIISGIVTAFGAILGFIATMNTQKKKTAELHAAAQQQFVNQIEDKLDAHRNEYLGRIKDVEDRVELSLDSVTDMRAQTQAWQSVMEVKFDALSEKCTKHNNLVERMQKAELNIAVLQNREKVSEHRLTDLEGTDS